ncbi:hypothetical protein IR073_06605 [Gemella sp. 19428wG2_WT2a]|nr:hypothetical protein [Gemella sp. 19428wG2_WT2a]TFU57705.1 hypothetical protein E4T67_06530 [Gemella sp. WT2a]
MLLLTASVLRIKYDWGKVRITNFISNLMEHMSDYKMEIYFQKSDIRAMLKKECSIDIDKLILSEANKHYERTKKPCRQTQLRK